MLYVDRQFADGRPPEEALKRSILLALKSPRFLYREVAGAGDAFDVASRLAFALWDAPPDGPLLDAAGSGQLKTSEQVEAQARRMADDPRAKAKLREFFLQWLKVEQVPDLAKDPALYPGFDAAVVSDLRTSLDFFLDDVISSPDADFRRLLLADDVYLNGRLAKFYGLEAPADAPFQRMPLDSAERSGVLSHPYLMASFAYTGSTSPIHRGVFVARSVLGRGLKQPPIAVSPLAPDLHASLTTRERVTLQTSPAACVTCHGMINPLGFGMERFDAVGRLRVEEKGKTDRRFRLVWTRPLARRSPTREPGGWGRSWLTATRFARRSSASCSTSWSSSRSPPIRLPLATTWPDRSPRVTPTFAR